MPILYEDIFKKRALAPVTDTQMTLTVTLAAGKGVILSASAFDATGADIAKAYPGQGIGLYVSIKNNGDTDIIWVSIKDKDTGLVLVRTDGVKCVTSTTLNAGATLGWTAANALNLVMPNKNFNLLIEAGHGA